MNYKLHIQRFLFSWLRLHILTNRQTSNSHKNVKFMRSHIDFVPVVTRLKESCGSRALGVQKQVVRPYTASLMINKVISDLLSTDE